MTDFRALCVELHAAFNTYAVDEPHHDLLVRARAALAESVLSAERERSRISIDEMCEILRSLEIKATEYTDCTILYEVTFDQLRAICDTRAALAEQPVGPTPLPGDAEGLAEVFWGRYAQPEPVGPTDEDLNDTYWTAWHKHLDRANSVLHSVGLRAVLARWGTPANDPVPVSERLPGPEDCDAERRCWWWNVTMDPDSPNWWSLESIEYIETEPYWLPHWALPVPDSN